MMNLLQVQDDLKNFSQDQLVKEMQQPSGSTPQFLVLSELNRRKRVKGDFEARQAQQQPTVAEEAVAAAGVPQEGMMGMPEAMAPQSAVSEGVGTSAPMKMASGGLAQFGNEIRNSMGQEIDPYLDGVQQEAEQKFNIDLDNNPQQIQPGMQAVPRPAIPMPMFPRPGYRGPPPQIGIGGKGMARTEPAVLRDRRDRYFTNADIPFGGQSRRFAEGGVIRAQDGLPNFRGFGKLGSDTRGDSFRRPNDPTITDDFEQTGNVDVGGLFGFGQPEPRSLMEIAKTGPRTMEELEILEQSEKQAEATAPLPVEPEPQAPKKPEPKLNLTSDDDSVLNIEQELRNRQQSIEDDREFAKYMAIAQAGLSILGSDKPTLAGAIGEGGTAGLTAFNEANKRYNEGLTDILNARSKLQQARITAGSKGKLTRSGALSAISSYNNSITAIRKEIADLNDMRGAPGVDEQIKELQDQIVGLETEKSQLYNTAQIRPRSSINVAGLPATQKSA
jgi:hypothetical protein